MLSLAGCNQAEAEQTQLSDEERVVRDFMLMRHSVAPIPASTVHPENLKELPAQGPSSLQDHAIFYAPGINRWRHLNARFSAAPFDTEARLQNGRLIIPDTNGDILSSYTMLPERKVDVYVPDSPEDTREYYLETFYLGSLDGRWYVLLPVERSLSEHDFSNVSAVEIQKRLDAGIDRNMLATEMNLIRLFSECAGIAKAAPVVLGAPNLASTFYIAADELARTAGNSQSYNANDVLRIARVASYGVTDQISALQKLSVDGKLSACMSTQNYARQLENEQAARVEAAQHEANTR